MNPNRLCLSRMKPLSVGLVLYRRYQLSISPPLALRACDLIAYCLKRERQGAQISNPFARIVWSICMRDY